MNFIIILNISKGQIVFMFAGFGIADESKNASHTSATTCKQVPSSLLGLPVRHGRPDGRAPLETGGRPSCRAKYFSAGPTAFLSLAACACRPFKSRSPMFIHLRPPCTSVGQVANGSDFSRAFDFTDLDQMMIIVLGVKISQVHGVHQDL